jgi:two-component system response regulator YesN
MIMDIKPDILITDIRMPFIDGLALSRIVKKNLPWIKIIILSGHDEFEYAREAISIGVEEYLLKPVSAQEMLKALEKIARRISEEKEELLDLEGLRVQSRLTQASGADSHQPDSKTANEEFVFDPKGLLNVDGDIFFTKLKYAAKKDIDSIVEEYITMLGSSWGEDPEADANLLLIYFLFGEIIVSASKIVEAHGGDIKEIVPVQLSRENIQEIIKSPESFSKGVKSILSAIIEFRDSHTAGRYQSVIVKTKEYIDSNFNNTDISLYSTAAHVGISPNHLSTVFAQETGENFIEYLTRLRIERAKLLLKSTTMKNADIASETGFNDPHYFSYIFKKNTGFSPREFRNS